LSLQERKVTYKESNYQVEDLITLKEAADLMGMSMPGVIQLIYRGSLTEVINQANPAHHGRRMVPRVEVDQLVASR
jgi:hypothetical protein